VLFFQPMPGVNLSETVDLKKWPLRKIIAHSQAWDRQQLAADKARERDAAAADKEARAQEAALAPATGEDNAAGGAASARTAAGRQRANAGTAQVRIGADGELLIDTNTLTLQAQRNQVAEYTRVDEDTRYINSMSYAPSSHAKGPTWSDLDTHLLYRSLSHFGTDFSLIAQLFPGRVRATHSLCTNFHS
jgi:hypothetical protein